MDLHEAASQGDVARVRELLDDGADVDSLDRWENTPLLLACFSEVHHPEAVALLRSHGADPHRRNVHWDTPRRKAYERYLMSGFDPLADLPRPEQPEPEEPHDLTDEELQAVASAVSALVNRDRTELDRMKAFDGGDPYEFTRPYGRWDQVDLVMPPGQPRDWAIRSYRDEDDDGVLPVEVDMWTRQEGRSDLTLELELHRDDAGGHRTDFRGLHVM